MRLELCCGHYCGSSDGLLPLDKLEVLELVDYGQFSCSCWASVSCRRLGRRKHRRAFLERLLLYRRLPLVRSQQYDTLGGLSACRSLRRDLLRSKQLARLQKVGVEHLRLHAAEQAEANEPLINVLDDVGAAQDAIVLFV